MLQQFLQRLFQSRAFQRLARGATQYEPCLDCFSRIANDQSAFPVVDHPHGCGLLDFGACFACCARAPLTVMSAKPPPAWFVIMLLVVGMASVFIMIACRTKMLTTEMILERVERLRGTLPPKADTSSSTSVMTPDKGLAKKQPSSQVGHLRGFFQIPSQSSPAQAELV